MAKIAIVFVALVAVTAAAVLPTEPERIVSQEQDVSPDGSFRTKFETEKGIAYQEEGSLKTVGDESAVVSSGSSSYVAPDGTHIQLTWTADENGFHPVGAHLPVAPAAPEIPAAIARALEWSAAHPYVEPETKRAAGRSSPSAARSSRF